MTMKAVNSKKNFITLEPEKIFKQFKKANRLDFNKNENCTIIFFSLHKKYSPLKTSSTIIQWSTATWRENFNNSFIV